MVEGGERRSQENRQRSACRAVGKCSGSEAREMTTIIYRAGVLAADTSVWDRGCYVGQIVKIWQRPDGRLAGFAGSMGEMALFRDWFLDGAVGDHPNFRADDAEGLICLPDGTFEWFGKDRAKVPIIAEYQAVGSGFRIALGALGAGASAEEALRIVAGIDDGTRGPFTILRQAQRLKVAG